MERGILWLTLLAAFIGLRQGRRNSIKSETYRSWRGDLKRAKYDIYAVRSEWQQFEGSPTPKGPIKLETFSLKDAIDSHMVDDKPDAMKEPQVRSLRRPGICLFSATCLDFDPRYRNPLAAELRGYLNRSCSSLPVGTRRCIHDHNLGLVGEIKTTRVPSSWKLLFLTPDNTNYRDAGVITRHAQISTIVCCLPSRIYICGRCCPSIIPVLELTIVSS